MKFVETGDDVIEIQTAGGCGVGLLHRLPTGEYAFKTLNSRTGYWDGDSLRAIADRLDELNEGS